ncbi:MAG TPA: hypothetical protein VFJ14_12925 [Nocardioidaceae bacterium]|nr:hypothetical protein [Nocardioidaceae bacterium]
MQTLKERKAHRDGGGPTISAGLLWFAVLGGFLSWAFHLIFAWSTLELACLRGNPGTLTNVVTGVGLTGVPWLVALAATVVAVMLRVRRRRADLDEIAQGRVDLMTQVGLILNLLSLAAITGGGVAIIVLDTCT